MNCPSCNHANPDAARFCNACGAALARRCPDCGADNPPGSRFCNACGASLAARSEPGPRASPSDEVEVRKVVTIVFADLIGSTALHERLDPESVSRVMERYHSAVRAPIEAYGGAVVQLLGDGVMSAFGVPRVAEDDAIRAVRAAVGIQQAFREFAREHVAVVGDVGLRVAVNTGEVVVSDDYAAGIGDPLNVAARLQQEARDGDVLIGESTERLVRDRVTLEPFGIFQLKGRAERVAAYRVVSLERPAGAPATPFVGRDDELRRLLGVFDSAVSARRARMAVVLGSPGLGKSRLIDEISRRLGESSRAGSPPLAEGKSSGMGFPSVPAAGPKTTVLTARCEATGSSTFAPIAEALHGLLRIDDNDAGDEARRAAIEGMLPDDEPERSRIGAGVAALLGNEPAPPEETFFVVRRFLAALATAPHPSPQASEGMRPVVLAIDDLQWAEPLLLDLIEHLVQWGSGVPLLVLAAARPDLRDRRSSLATPGALVSDVVTLGGLDAAAATRLAADVIGAAALPAAVAGRVLATSEGNPLFVSELVRMLVNDGALKREGDRWTAAVDLAVLDMPPTIHALLAARIERLRAEDRLVLERAAIVGRQFSRAAVAHLLPREAQGDLDARLEALRRSELIEPDTTWFLGEPALRFHHGLTRDAAYRRVLKGTRAELHGCFADWIESRIGQLGAAIEHDETIGWHLEQAHQHLRELGPIDKRGRAFGERAARYLGAAGRRALARDDLPVAANLLGRAIGCLEAADSARADLALNWCEALLSAGDVGPAASAIEELARFATGPTRDQKPETRDRLRAWHTCFAGRLAVLTDPQALHATAGAVAAAADELAAAGDGAGEANAHLVHALALSRLGKVGACEAALDKALAAARRAHDRRRANTVLANAPLAALWGPSPVTRASGRCLDVVRVLRITQGAPAVEAVALRCQAVLEALRGRTEAAHRMIASSRRMVEELGITHRLLEADVFAGLIDLLEGDAAAAERGLRAAYGGLREHGLGIDAAQAAALLGRALLLQDRAAEAEALSHESEALAGDDLQAAIAWRGVRAEALALRGEHASAVEFARAAVDIAAATDALLHHADARLALAAALRAAGRQDEAVAEQARALELWEAKGATVLAERARLRPEAFGGRARRGAGRTSVEQPVPAVDSAAPARPVRRRVEANAATAHAARVCATIAARDADALPTLVADGSEVVYHPTRSVYDMKEALRTWRSLMKARGGTLALEPLATLGDSLALCRHLMSATGAAGEKFDVGPYEVELITLVEVDEQGRRRRSEFFALERLGDAIARLYERHAELLPEDPERVRAAATARSAAAILTVFDLDRWAGAFAPDIESVDHRTLGSCAHGKEPLLQHIRALLDLIDNFGACADDLLALRSDAFLVRRLTWGTLRAGGGVYERPFLALWAFGPDGLITRWEQFDVGQEAEALARFDALAARSKAVPSRIAEKRERRVRPNAATANAAGADTAVAARDSVSLENLIADRFEAMDHTTGTRYERQGMLATYASLLHARDPSCLHEALATLGDSLALLRLSASASGFVGRQFDVGAYDKEEIALYEVDADGRRRRSEIFAGDRLGDAVVRLYERYAELVPTGPERECAVTTARSVAAVLREPAHRWPFAPDVEATDGRTVGFGSLRGADAVVQASRALLELTEESIWRCDDVLGLRSDALLVRRTQSGTDRAGSEFERRVCHLWIFGPDGLATHWAQFDAEQAAEALARFDALAAPPPAVSPTRSRVRPNAATAHAARLDTVIAAHDAEAVPGLFADEMEAIDHITHTTWDRQAVRSSWRSLALAEDPTCRHQPLATLGDTQALCRVWLSASRLTRGNFDVGGYEKAEIHLIEVDAQGRRRWTEVFAVEKLAEAVMRLYERHAEAMPEGPARARAAAIARSVSECLRPLEIESRRAILAPDVEFVDRRTLGLGSARGTEAYLRAYRVLIDVARDRTLRVDEVLAARSNSLLLRLTAAGVGRAGGGTFENEYIQLWVFATDGLLTRAEQFDADRDDQALARFDELAADAPEPLPQPLSDTVSGAGSQPILPPSLGGRGARGLGRTRRVRPNAATAHAARLDGVIAAQNADAVPRLFADELVLVDHITGVTFDRERVLGSWRVLLKAEHPMAVHEPLASLGSSLALFRWSMSARGFVGRTFDVGAYEQAEVALIEVDAQKRARRRERFSADRLGDAVVRLYQRYAELLPHGPARERAAATALTTATLLGPIDDDFWAAAIAPAIEVVDHRMLGSFSGFGAEALLQNLRSWLDLGADLALSVDDVLGLESGALLARRTFRGTDRAGGGAFERQLIQLLIFGTDGLTTHLEIFEGDGDAEALARFDELANPSVSPLGKGRTKRGSPPARFENAATRAGDRIRKAMEGQDWERFTTLFPAGFRSIDRQRMALLEADRDGYLKAWRPIFETFTSSTVIGDLLATRGDRLVLTRVRWTGSGHCVGPSEFEWLEIFEVDQNGDLVAEITFDPDAFEAAYAEIDERYFAGEAAPYTAMLESMQRLLRGAAARDWEAVAALHAPDFVIEDHSPLGWGTLDRSAYLESVKALAALAPDFRVRTDHLWLCDRGALGVHVVLGTHAGGAFEQPRVTVSEIDAQGRERRRDVYTLDQLDEARVRFEAIGVEAAADPVNAVRDGPAATSSAPRDPLAALAKPNAATVALDRLQAAFEARDWAAMRAACTADAKIEDRRQHIQVSLQVDAWIADWQRIVRTAPDAHFRRRLAGTAGARVDLEGFLWRGRPAGAEDESEHLLLTEVDDRGRIASAVVFDAGDWRAAHREAVARWLAADAAAAAVIQPILEIARGFNDRDRERMRAVLADDVIMSDHRLSGLGEITGAEAYIRSLAVTWPAVPDIQSDWFPLVREAHGSVGVGGVFGTFEGGTFEVPLVSLLIVTQGRVTRIETFELEDVDAALVRFEELRLGR